MYREVEIKLWVDKAGDPARAVEILIEDLSRLANSLRAGKPSIGDAIVCDGEEIIGDISVSDVPHRSHAGSE